LNHIDLFSGLGGFSLACQWNGIQTEVFCEKDERCRKFLERTYPGIPVLPDIREFDGTLWTGRFLLTAGTPCQPASRAGKQRGTEDDRWLWEEVIRIISESRPDWILCENPPGIWDVALDRVPFKVESRTLVRTEVQDSYRGLYSRQESLFVGGFYKRLEAMGYELAPPIEIAACSVDSPQLRERVWIVAHNESDNLQYDPEQGADEKGYGRERVIDGSGCLQIGTDACNGHMAHSTKDDDRRPYPRESERQVSQSGSSDGSIGSMAHNLRSRRRTDEQGERPERRDADGRDCEGDLADTGLIQHGRRDSESFISKGTRARHEAEGLLWSRFVWVPCADGKLRRAPCDSFGLVDGLHRSVLAALGNSIVPAVAAEVIKAIKGAS
jgi:site-specific DNA-cytosine methylase